MLLNLIKQAASEENDTKRKTEILTGVVIARDKDKYPKATDDITMLIQTDPKIQLDLDFLMFSQTSAGFEYDVGDRFFIIQIQGGQRFLVFDKIFERVSE